MRFLVLVTLFFAVAAPAADAPYYRFWRGMKREYHVKDSGKKDAEGFRIFEEDKTRPMTTKEFRDLINEWLIPATTSCCAESSLVAYMPLLTEEGKKPASIPDEIALIVYSSEDAYKKTRADKKNIEAYTYGPLHGDVFDMAKSNSLVPTAYAGKVDLNPAAAYDVLSTPVDWQKGYTFVRIALLNQKANLERHLSDVKANAAKLNLMGYVVLVTKDYIVEYQNWLERAAWKAHYHRASMPETKPVLEMVASELKQTPGKDPLRYDPLSFEKAGTVIFTPGKKPIPAQKHHRLP